MSKNFPSKFHRINSYLVAVPFGLCAIAGAQAQVSGSPPEGLAVYFPAYGLPGRVPPYSSLPPPGFPPEVRVNGGGLDRPPITTFAGTFFTLRRFMNYEVRGRYGVEQFITVFDAWPGACSVGPGVFPMPRRSNEIQTRNIAFDDSFNGLDCSTDRIELQPYRWQFTDRSTAVAPARRKAIDGSEYEAAALVIERDGAPWMTYFAGYRLGIVASASNWNDADRNRSVALSTWPSYPNSRDNFELAKLPPPFVEGELVEYEYRVGVPAEQRGLFSYALNLDEQTAMDKLTDWERTGRRIKTGGYLPVCRFDTSTTGGVAGRFFSASERDCAALLSAPGLAAKGVAFRASLPIKSTGICPAATVAITRLYNNGIARGVTPNHRYVSRGDDQEPIDVAMARILGWVNEGVAFCVPQ